MGLVGRRLLQVEQEAAGHGGFFGMAPEDEEITREIRQFVARHLGRS
jgi:hypothetical protein